MKFGGAEQVLLTYLLNFDRKKYTVELLLHTCEGELLTNLPKDVKVRSLVPKDDGKLFSKFKRSFFFKSLNYNSFFLALFLKIIFNKSDLTVAFMEGIATNIASHFNGPKIAWIHTDVNLNPWADSFFRNKKNQKKIYEKFDKIVFVSKGGKNEFNKKFPSIPLSKEVVIHNLVDRKKIEVLSEKTNKNFEDWKTETKGTIRLISVGRLDPVKRMDLLENAFRNIDILKFPVSLTIIGAGSEGKKLRSIASLEKKSRIYLLGKKDNPMPYVKNSILFVSTSFVESYPTAIIEALILGTPVLATKNAGSSEVLGDSINGKVIQSNPTSKTLSQEIEKVLSRINVWNDKANAAKDEFEIQKVLTEYDNLFEKIGE